MRRLVITAPLRSARRGGAPAVPARTVLITGTRIRRRRWLSSQAEDASGSPPPIHPVKDKTEALRMVDNVLKQPGPASIEYVLVNPLWRQVRFPVLGALAALLRPGRTGGSSQSAANPYGHAMVRYRVPQGVGPVPVHCSPGDSGRKKSHSTSSNPAASDDVVLAHDGDTVCFNIVGAPGASRMVNFLCPETYFFAREGAEDTGAEQGGIDHRSMVSVRLERVDSDKIQQMHEYFLGVQEAEREGRASYTMVFRGFYDIFRRIFPALAEHQNCAGWTSRGLQRAGVVARSSSFPKLILIDLLTRHAITDPENCNVVFWDSRNRDLPSEGAVAPFRWWLSKRWWRLEQFANAHVTIADDGQAHVVLKTPHWKSVVKSWGEWAAQFRRNSAVFTGNAFGDAHEPDAGELNAPCLTHGDCGGAQIDTMEALTDTLHAHTGLLVFSRTTCGHGYRLQVALSRAEIDFTICFVDSVPRTAAIRRALQDLTMMSTVPSVWVCKRGSEPRFLGGAAETISMIDAGSLELMLNEDRP